MKALVSTMLTQGRRPNDFSFVPEGEILYPGTVCDRDKNNPDGQCGCSRSMSGTKTQKATSTFRVVELDETIVQNAVRNALAVSGWPLEWFPDAMFTIERATRDYHLTTILERRGDLIFRPRSLFTQLGNITRGRAEGSCPGCGKQFMSTHERVTECGNNPPQWMCETCALRVLETPPVTP